jgi:hypothetical protein
MGRAGRHYHDRRVAWSPTSWMGFLLFSRRRGEDIWSSEETVDEDCLKEKSSKTAWLGRWIDGDVELEDEVGWIVSPGWASRELVYSWNSSLGFGALFRNSMEHVFDIFHRNETGFDDGIRRASRDCNIVDFYRNGQPLWLPGTAEHTKHC